MRTISNRLDRLEERRGSHDQCRNQIEEDAAFVMAKITSLVGHGHRLDAADRARWDAWSERFLPDTGRTA
jgi:hypothetical protein